MSSTAVLVFSASSRSRLVRAAVSAGWRPTVVRRIGDVLDVLRRARFAALLLDRAWAEVDSLEFVLNVRDVDASVPVVIVGGPVVPEDRVLESQAQTYVLGGGTPMADLSALLRDERPIGRQKAKPEGH